MISGKQSEKNKIWLFLLILRSYMYYLLVKYFFIPIAIWTIFSVYKLRRHLPPFYEILTPERLFSLENIFVAIFSIEQAYHLFLISGCIVHSGDFKSKSCGYKFLPLYYKSALVRFNFIKKKLNVRLLHIFCSTSNLSTLDRVENDMNAVFINTLEN